LKEHSVFVWDFSKIFSFEGEMAKEEAAVEGAAPKKKGKLMIIIIAVVAVVLIGGGVGAYLLLSKPAAEKHAAQDGEEAGLEDEESGEEEGEAGEAPIYVKLETFTLNLADGESYLQTEMQLLVSDAKFNEKMNARIPEVRDALIRLLTSKTAEELSQPEGKDKLADEVQKQINSVLGIKGKGKGVKKVLFGAFIIQ
jgi:flagellar protein FliL